MTDTRNGSSGRFVRFFIAFFVIVLSLAGTLACEKSDPLGTTSPTVQPGTYTGQATWTEEFMGTKRVLKGENVQIWIQGQGSGINYFGVLGSILDGKIVFDSKTELLSDSLLPGIFYTTTFTGEADGPMATIVEITHFYYADGTEAVPPYQVTFRSFDLTGPRSLPASVAPDAIFYYVDSPSLAPVSVNLAREGLHDLMITSVRERLRP